MCSNGEDPDRAPRTAMCSAGSHIYPTLVARTGTNPMIDYFIRSTRLKPNTTSEDRRGAAAGMAESPNDFPSPAKPRPDGTEIQCLAVDKARMNSTVPCTLGRQIENRQSRLSTVADVLHTTVADALYINHCIAYTVDGPCST
jgi:hypothetical protein